MKKIFNPMLLKAFFCLLLFAGTIHLAAAATINVDITKDEYNTSGSGSGCSLREAIQAANTNAAFGGCAAGSKNDVDVIKLNADLKTEDTIYKITIPPTSSDNSAGDFDISSSLTIQGADNNIPLDLVTINGNGLDRVFDISGAQGDNLQVTFEHVHISNGKLTQQNGAGINQISPGGTLTVKGSIISNNVIEGAGSGGGIANTNGTVKIVDSIIDLNHVKNGSGGAIYTAGSTTDVQLESASILANIASNAGGGIKNDGGKLTINKSTLAFNIAENESGGGLSSSSSNAKTTITNSTISSNLSSVSGGGIANLQGTMQLKNVTVASNHADSDAAVADVLNEMFGDVPQEIKGPIINFISQKTKLPNPNDQGEGGGIANFVDGKLELNNSVIAANADDSSSAKTPDIYCDNTTNVTSLNYNFISVVDGCALTMTSNDISGTLADPKPSYLLPLQLNGSTEAVGIITMLTHRPGQNGDIVDTGYSCFGDTDQRGYPRIDALMGKCDRGAFELEASYGSNSPDPDNSNNPPVITLNPNILIDLNSNNSDTNDIPIIKIPNFKPDPDGNINISINPDLLKPNQKDWLGDLDPDLIAVLFNPDPASIDYPVEIDPSIFTPNDPNDSNDQTDTTDQTDTNDTTDTTDPTDQTDTNDQTDTTDQNDESDIIAPPTLPQDKWCGKLYSDLSVDDPDCEAFLYMRKVGSITGYGTTSKVGPDDYLQRDQMVKIATIMNQLTEKYAVFDKKIDYCKGINPFEDVTVKDWVYQYACYAKNKIAFGYDGKKLVPNGTLIRPEFLAFAFRILNDEMPSIDSVSYSDVKPGAYPAEYAKYAKDNGIFPGEKLYINQKVTRREVARAFYQLNKLGKLEKAPL